MQTFLPYKSFIKSAKCLDYKRLGKQRVEAKQIYLALTNPGSSRWENHPAVRMWKGYEQALVVYGIAVCTEWKYGRGFKDNQLAWFIERLNITQYTGDPPWLGLPEFHLSHQSNLIRKNPQFYKTIFGNDVPDNIPYIWPVKN
jgi:hypothetical protein